MLRLLKESIFEGHPCNVIFYDPTLLSDRKLLSIHGMQELITRLKEIKDKPFPTDLKCESVGHRFYRVKHKDARIIFSTISVDFYVIVVDMCRRKEDTYDDVNTSSGLKKLTNRFIDAYNRYKKKKS